jgi:hypothetical protein
MIFGKALRSFADLVRHFAKLEIELGSGKHF